MKKAIAIALVAIVLFLAFDYAMVKDKQSLCDSGQMTIEQC